MLSTLRFASAAWGAGLRSALEYRGAFAIQAAFMALNNFIFLGFWAVFFARFPAVAGWDLRDVALLYAVTASGFGIAVVTMGGTLDVARRAAQGRLDTWLLRSRPVFLQAGVSHVMVSGFGDLASGIILFALAGRPTPGRTAAYVVAALVAATVLVLFALLANALTFHAPGAQELGQQGVYCLVTFALYPPGLFGGAARWVLLLVLPAGLMGHLPVELVRSFRWEDAALLAAGVAGLFVATTIAWRVGLARYESGNLVQGGD